VITSEKIVLGKETWRIQEIESVAVLKHETRHRGQWMALDERTLPGLGISAILSTGAYFLALSPADFPGKLIILVVLWASAVGIFGHTWISNLEPSYSLVFTHKSGAKAESRKLWKDYDKAEGVVEAISGVLDSSQPVGAIE